MSENLTDKAIAWLTESAMEITPVTIELAGKIIEGGDNNIALQEKYRAQLNDALYERIGANDSRLARFWERFWNAAEEDELKDTLVEFVENNPNLEIPLPATQYKVYVNLLKEYELEVEATSEDEARSIVEGMSSYEVENGDELDYNIEVTLVEKA